MLSGVSIPNSECCTSIDVLRGRNSRLRRKNKKTSSQGNIMELQRRPTTNNESRSTSKHAPSNANGIVRLKNSATKTRSDFYVKSKNGDTKKCNRGARAHTQHTKTGNTRTALPVVACLDSKSRARDRRRTRAATRRRESSSPS